MSVDDGAVDVVPTSPGATADVGRLCGSGTDGFDLPVSISVLTEPEGR